MTSTKLMKLQARSRICYELKNINIYSKFAYLPLYEIQLRQTFRHTSISHHKNQDEVVTAFILIVDKDQPHRKMPAIFDGFNLYGKQVRRTSATLFWLL